jgi:hypothetical protein
VGACLNGVAFLLQLYPYVRITQEWLAYLGGRSYPAGPDEMGAAVFLLVIAALLGMGANLCALIGYGLCLAGPNVRSATGAALGCLATGVLSLFFGLTVFLVLSAESPLLLVGVLNVLQVLYGVESILAAVLVRGYARTLQEDGPARAATRLLVLAGCFLILRLVTINAAAVFSAIEGVSMTKLLTGGGAVLALWAAALMYSIYICWYAIVLWNLRIDLAARAEPAQ